MTEKNPFEIPRHVERLAEMKQFELTKAQMMIVSCAASLDAAAVAYGTVLLQSNPHATHPLAGDVLVNLQKGLQAAAQSYSKAVETFKMIEVQSVTDSYPWGLWNRETKEWVKDVTYIGGRFKAKSEEECIVYRDKKWNTEQIHHFVPMKFEDIQGGFWEEGD